MLRSLSFVVAAGSLLVSACGGTPAPVSEGPSPSTEASPAAEPSTAPDEPEPARVDCDDGSCLSCGAGFCPLGAYCELDANGEGACAWVAECPGNPTCACIGKALGNGCTCSDAPAGPTLRCSP